MKFRSAGGPSPQSEALPPLPCPMAPWTPCPCPAQPSPCVGPRWSTGRSGIPMVTWAPSLLRTRVCGPCVLTKRERPVRCWKGLWGVGALPAPWTQECSPANMGRGCHGPSVQRHHAPPPGRCGVCSRAVPPSSSICPLLLASTPRTRLSLPPSPRSHPAHPQPRGLEWGRPGSEPPAPQ